ncbi:hypothetical protein C9I57_29055 [Trinickia symbiotica]|uniref:DUF2325 domain-containing protein n=1 Tax=Trinickia symbiotica TaxID=863227 RepID=A0A2T3XLB9_9BURK|nr:DUF2325 domain-containing protein [Trinickia symbiotica]PTB17257.1 hypothetical protein C9I57_29055 [Trinickia symbiotica]
MTASGEGRLHAHLASLAHELQWVERVLLDGGALNELLAGRRFVYVGGRPRSNAVLRERLAHNGGTFIHHIALIDADGSARERRFTALLSGVDAVLCPLDTIDPESLSALRILCSRHGVPWIALRTSSVGSFVAGLLKAACKPCRRAALPHPGFCMRG